MRNTELTQDELQRKWLTGFRLHGLMTLVFRSLTLAACAHASRSKDLQRNPLGKLRERIFNWVDHHLQLCGNPLPPVHLKEQLFRSFTELAASQAKFPFTDKDPTHCPVCGSKLESAYTEPLVCESCIQPVLDALDNLVRASVTGWTPEDLRKSYLEALQSVPETE